ncbi:MAG: glycosyltransferase [Pseudomonadota bacterium]
MKVLLLANYRPDGQESMQRFADMLSDGLTQHGHEVRVLRPEPRLLQAGGTPKKLEKWLGYVDKLVLFPSVLREAARWADIVHICDHSNAFYVKYLDGRHHLVTCHDMLAIRSAMGEIPQNRTRWSGRVQQRMILRGLRAAQHIACVSRQTQSEVQRIVQRPEGDTTLVYNGLNYPYAPMGWAAADQRLGKLLGAAPGPFFLHVGGNNWYKNRPGVLKIFRRLAVMPQFREHRLLMVGKPWTPAMRQYVHAHGLAERVLEIHNVDNEDLRACYSRASALLFPSLQEGFGWPIVEAQACGCPVVTSQRAPMTEVGGSAAVYIDPEQPEAAAGIIVSRLAAAEAIRQAGLKNAQRFSPDGMITSYIRLYAEVCNENPAFDQIREPRRRRSC